MRKVTGIPSPKQFQVDQIPMLAEECRRIYAITNQFKEVIFEAEKQVIRRCLRKREEAETVISEMKQLLNAATQKDYATLNTTLAKWEEREITAFFRRDHDCMANY
ncbi:hypothetical protein SK355_13220 [Candidatus Fukatsuia symbiotica]|uniref:hypothetical protein n=1 Tax=Candidatus Fukatsuia symbiotica TaxID=1878942 RepID=UPI001966FA49|nr:hypothetical protein [Candidatus Fukatsuia symbiotica]MEA9446120.1 hypothetical protein [Candidatus Fukatsuia symbiotica]